jgi:lipoprotein-anchoring transpeptidase ErfK/SrfK
VDTRHEIIVSVKDQQLLLKTDGKTEAIYPVSTSRFGIGDRFGSYATPLGKFLVRMKIGMGKPLGTVFHSRVPTGEVLKPNAPGRDPIVTRILWLEGEESGNRNAFNRGIYIHGTPQENLLGRPASFGCVRMRSADVAALCDRVSTGATVRIIPEHLPSKHESALMNFLNPHALVASHTRAPEHPCQQVTQ